MQNQREKERQREGVDDTWADRFVTESARRPPQSQPRQQLPPPPPYASGGVMERSVLGVTFYEDISFQRLRRFLLYVILSPQWGTAD